MGERMFTDYTIIEAKGILSKHIIAERKTEIIKLEEAYDRIIGENVIAGCNVPGFDRSMMDGYVVRSIDINGASKDNPIILRLIGAVEMGKTTNYHINEGECVYIPTGGMLPTGGDSVIMIEKTSASGDEIFIFDKTVEYENIIKGDEDAKIGNTVVEIGTRLRPYEIGVMSSIGYVKPIVFKKPRIAIVSTGDELVDPENTPLPGQVRDINTNLLKGLILEAGGIPVIYNSNADIYEKIYETVRIAVEECDIVLISGGSSVGLKDYTIKVIKEINGTELMFHGLALKPGKPTIAAICGNKPIFGMPGHPLSCAVVFKTLVQYSMELLAGYHHIEYPIPCRLKSSCKKAKNREEYIPVKLEFINGECFAIPISGKSGIISTFSRAFGYVTTKKEQVELNQGEQVLVYRL